MELYSPDQIKFRADSDGKIELINGKLVENVSNRKKMGTNYAALESLLSAFAKPDTATAQVQERL